MCSMNMPYSYGEMGCAVCCVSTETFSCCGAVGVLCWATPVARAPLRRSAAAAPIFVRLCIQCSQGFRRQIRRAKAEVQHLPRVTSAFSRIAFAILGHG